MYAEQAVGDLERPMDFLIEFDPVASAETIDQIEEAVGVLKRHPLIVRPAEAVFANS